MSQGEAKYRRILLKMSGAALSGDHAVGIAPSMLDYIVTQVAQVTALGVQVAIVVGGGNLFRGAALSQAGITRITADHMGMMATVMNALALRDAFERAGHAARVLSAISMTGVVEDFSYLRAQHHLASGRVVIFSAGTGSPLVTTDSAASLRAIEIDADILLKGTQVDGVYDSDPAKNRQARRYAHCDYNFVLKKELAVMDLSAFCQCRDHNMPIQVFNVHQPGALLKVVKGASEGTIISHIKGENSD